MTVQHNESNPASPTEKSLAVKFAAIHERLRDLEEKVERKNERIAQLEKANADLSETVTEMERQLAAQAKENTRLERCVEAITKKANTNKQRVAELQSRELEKGAHLRVEMVDEQTIEVPGRRLEKITKESQPYYRLPEHADPLERTGQVSLAYGDLLPIQQLSRMDADMLRSTANALPTRLAAQLWKARRDPAVGDNPWERGCGEIKEYVKASDLKHWIRRQEPGVSDTYAKKLVSRTIDALVDLSKNRVAVRKRSERKNGLRYTERQVILPADAELPGETVGVHG